LLTIDDPSETVTRVFPEEGDPMLKSLVMNPEFLKRHSYKYVLGRNVTGLIPAVLSESEPGVTSGELSESESPLF
jgi:hypothetical protein